ncbi:MAG TPA: RdgB/HAM1 family non-canonical purine NTP pyrophosphatase [Candidatus Latescibacteria bacterium]|nr:MAG: Non-canonical purine NTP pyrophosphatase [Candidatus Latescibacteria bacterium ADurb.Bin168]HPU85322.1 RdgB/HAM1 family non-canonical purine NTP pyrophosphatase [Candidatus Latescibacterota bacterium]
MPFQIVAATRNRGKLREIQSLYGDLPLMWRPMDDIGSPPIIEETGTTFQDNALLKARGIAKWSGFAALGEDSGLEVDALAGDPGVRSARFAGEHASDKENIALLLRRLEGIPRAERTARFICVVALVWTDGTEVVAKGTCEGHIAEEPAGTSGFGYDPLFIPEGQVATFAELGETFKNTVSHRARALRGLRPWLEGRIRYAGRAPS